MKLLSQAVSATVGLVTWYVAPVVSAISTEDLKLVAAGVALSVFAVFVVIGARDR